MRRDETTKLGHVCTGGGAEIKNSPINIHIHIHGATEPVFHKVKRSIYGLIGRRHTAVEGAERLSGNELQGIVSERLADR